MELQKLKSAPDSQQKAPKENKFKEHSKMTENFLLKVDSAVVSFSEELAKVFSKVTEITETTGSPLESLFVSVSCQTEKLKEGFPKMSSEIPFEVFNSDARKYANFKKHPKNEFQSPVKNSIGKKEIASMYNYFYGSAEDSEFFGGVLHECKVFKKVCTYPMLNEFLKTHSQAKSLKLTLEAFTDLHETCYESFRTEYKTLFKHFNRLFKAIKETLECELTKNPIKASEISYLPNCSKSKKANKLYNWETKSKFKLVEKQGLLSNGKKPTKKASNFKSLLKSENYTLLPSIQNSSQKFFSEATRMRSKLGDLKVKQNKVRKQTKSLAVFVGFNSLPENTLISFNN